MSEIPRTPEQPLMASIEAPKTTVLKKMPDPELLDAFVSGLLGGRTRAVFDAREGQFKWLGVPNAYRK